MGLKNYGNARELPILSDSGGSNSNRSRLWKYYLYKFAREIGLKITVCHYPAGARKWNRIEHKVFLFIRMNWKGKPFRTNEIMLNLIEGTKTGKELKISAKLDRKIYKTGKNGDQTDFKKIKIRHHKRNQHRNYTIN
ncbi:MAG: ISAzo13-like element transposase-related protein [Thermoplasmataceae archaeon]